MSDRVLLITGVTGCVGRAIAAAALGTWRVRGLARHHTHPEVPGVDFVLADVRDRTAVQRAMERCHAVVHLAGWVHRLPRGDRDLEELRSSIVDGTAVVAEAARAASATLVITSSVAVFGRGSADEPTRPHTPYGRAKLEAEAVAQAADPRCIVVRPALVYGPHDRGNVMRLIRLIDNRLGVVLGDGGNRKSIVHVENLADRILACLERPDLAGVWTAADDPAPTQAEIVREISSALGRRPPRRLPRWPLELAAAAIDRVVRTTWRLRVDSLTRSTEYPGFALDRALDYAPRVEWRDGIRAQVQRWKSA